MIHSPHLQAIQKGNFWLCLGESQDKLEQSSLLLPLRQRGFPKGLMGWWPAMISLAGEPRASGRGQALTAPRKQLPSKGK